LFLLRAILVLLDACGAVCGLFERFQSPAFAGDVEDISVVQEPVEDAVASTSSASAFRSARAPDR